MEPGGSVPHSQGLSNNPILSRINPITSLIPISTRSILILFSHLRLGLPKGLFPVGLPVTILKARNTIQHLLMVQDPRTPRPHLFSDGQNMYNRVVLVCSERIHTSGAR